MAALPSSGPWLLSPRHTGQPMGAAAVVAATLVSADVSVCVEKERLSPWFFQAGTMKTKEKSQEWDKVARRG